MPWAVSGSEGRSIVLYEPLTAPNQKFLNYLLVVRTLTIYDTLIQYNGS